MQGKILSVLFFTGLLMYSSCSNNETSNPITPSTNDTLFTISLLEAKVNPGITSTSFNSNSFTYSNTASNIRLEFTVQSNADSSLGCNANYLDSTNGSPMPPSPQTINVYGSLDTSYSINLSVPIQPFYSKFNVRMTVTNSSNTIIRYMRFVNVRVIKVS